MVPDTLSNQYLIVDNRVEKIIFLLNFMVINKNQKVIVFFNTCCSVDFYLKLFKELKFLKKLKLSGIHGQMKQKKRAKII